MSCHDIGRGYQRCLADMINNDCRSNVCFDKSY